MIPGVVHLPAELKRVRFAYAGVLEHLKIVILDSGLIQDIASSVAHPSGDSAVWQQLEGIDVEEAIQSAFAFRQIAVSYSVRPRHAGGRTNTGAREVHGR